MWTKAILFFVVVFSIATTGYTQPSPEEVVDRVVAAAQALLETLDDTRQEAILFAFDDEEQRWRYSNLPLTMFERRGLLMADLNDEQKSAVLNLIRTTLSEEGYQQVLDNMMGGEMLRMAEGSSSPFGGDQYYISILGTPSTTTPWTWQYGGHHLGINATIVGEKITLAPSLTGGQPMVYEHEGRQVRQMDDEIEAAFALVQSLTPEQKEQAILGDRFVNWVFGPTDIAVVTRQAGIPTEKMNEEQQVLLLDLIGKRIGILNETHAQIAMQRIKDNLSDIWFSWYGPTEHGSASTYRIQSPVFVMEYSPQGMGGNPTQHVHAIYRDPSNEYGAEFLDQ